MSTKRMLLIAMSISIIFVLEQAMLIIPNVQLTVLLIILFSSIFTFKESIIMVLIYVFLDSLYMGTLNPFYIIPLVIGWSFIPIAYNTFLNRTNSELVLSIFALFFGFIYGWVFIPFRMIQYGVDVMWPYLVGDIVFEIVMAVVGFTTVILLFKPLKRVLDQLILEEIYIEAANK